MSEKRDYLVWCHEDGQHEEDGWHVIAPDAYRAAEMWAKCRDIYSADYSICAGSQVEVCVEYEGIVNRFRVHVETVPQYSAKIIAEE